MRNQGVITSFPNSSGYASGLLGFLQLGSAALSSALVGRLTQGSQNYLSYYLFVVTLIGIILFYQLLIFNRKNSLQEADIS